MMNSLNFHMPKRNQKKSKKILTATNQSFNQEQSVENEFASPDMKWISSERMDQYAGPKKPR